MLTVAIVVIQIQLTKSFLNCNFMPFECLLFFMPESGSFLPFCILNTFLFLLFFPRLHDKFNYSRQIIGLPVGFQSVDSVCELLQIWFHYIMEDFISRNYTIKMIVLWDEKNPLPSVFLFHPFRVLFYRFLRKNSDIFIYASST